MSPDRSTIVLVHGAWGGAWCWERVVPLLEQRGLVVRTLDLPSVGGDPADEVDLTGDAAAVAAVLDDVEGPALVCGHSYGGMVITQAAAGRDDVTQLVYLCAFMPDAGESLLSIVGQPPPWIVPQDDGRTLPDPAQLVEVTCADCDAESQRVVSERVRPMTPAPFAEPLAEASWRRIPSTYVVCTEDMAIPVELQRGLFAPRAAEVVEMDASHFPQFSQPAAVAELLAARA